MHDIIDLSPNITYLFVPLTVGFGDSITGLRRALPLMNPDHLILVDQYTTDHYHIGKIILLVDYKT